MDSVTEAALKSYRQDIDHLEEQLDRTTRVILMLACHHGYIAKDELTRIVANPQQVHVHVVYSENMEKPTDEGEEPETGPGIALEITQASEDDDAKLKAKLLPRFKLERAYIAEREARKLEAERADRLHLELLRAGEQPTDDQDLEAEKPGPKIGQPIPPTLVAKDRGD